MYLIAAVLALLALLALLVLVKALAPLVSSRRDRLRVGAEAQPPDPEGI